MTETSQLKPNKKLTPRQLAHIAVIGGLAITAMFGIPKMKKEEKINQPDAIAIVTDSFKAPKMADYHALDGQKHIDLGAIRSQADINRVENRGSIFEDPRQSTELVAGLTPITRSDLTPYVKIKIPGEYNGRIDTRSGALIDTK